MAGDDDQAPALSDTPLADRMWDGLLAWMSGTFAICAVAIAISSALGFPRREAAQLSGGQIGFLITQAVLCCAYVVRTGWRLCRGYPGAVAVAFAAGIPGALALLLAVEWGDASDPMATWAALLLNSVRLAALEAAPVGYLLYLLRHGPIAWSGAGRTSETS